MGKSACVKPAGLKHVDDCMRRRGTHARRPWAEPFATTSASTAPGPLVLPLLLSSSRSASSSPLSWLGGGRPRGPKAPSSPLLADGAGKPRPPPPPKDSAESLCMARLANSLWAGVRRRAFQGVGRPHAPSKSPFMGPHRHAAWCKSPLATTSMGCALEFNINSQVSGSTTPLSRRPSRAWPRICEAKHGALRGLRSRCRNGPPLVGKRAAGNTVLKSNLEAL